MKTKKHEQLYGFRKIGNPYIQEKGYLTDTCLSAQDTFKNYLDYFRIPYDVN